MRIGIDAREISHRKRHGRRTYVENLVKSLSRVDSENRYILYLDRKDPFHLDGLAPNFTIKILPWHIRFFSTLLNDHFFLPRRICRDNLDLIHYTTSAVNFSHSINTTKIIITVHDALPFFSRAQPIIKHGIVNILYSKYNAALIESNLKRQVFVITISEKSKEDLLRFTDISPDRISLVYEAASDSFQMVNNQTLINEIKGKYDLGNEFILGFAHKNGERIVEAYATLPDGLRNRMKIGLIWFRDKFPEHLKKIIHKNKVEDRVVCIPPVKGRELVLLYNAASIFVFPSFYEGFGLPVLEAMKCGCPVICSNRGSLPEVARDAALFVEELDNVSLCVKELSQKIQMVLRDLRLKKQMISRGFQRASEFSWEKTAAETLAVYRSICRTEK